MWVGMIQKTILVLALAGCDVLAEAGGKKYMMGVGVGIEHNHC